MGERKKTANAATHGDGEGNRRVQVIMPEELLENIQTLSRRSDLSIGHYVRRLCRLAASKKWMFEAETPTEMVVQEDKPRTDYAGAAPQNTAAENNAQSGRTNPLK